MTNGHGPHEGGGNYHAMVEPLKRPKPEHGCKEDESKERAVPNAEKASGSTPASQKLSVKP